MEQYDAIVATTPSYTLRRLVPGLPEGYMARLSGVEYMAAVLIILVLDRPLSRVYWMNVADRSIPFVGVIEQTNLIGPEHYGGKHIVYLSNYLAADDRLYGLSHRGAAGRVRAAPAEDQPGLRCFVGVEQLLPPGRGRAAGDSVNYSQRIPDHRTPLRGLYLANTTQIYPEDRGTSYSVRIGRRVARWLWRTLGRVSRPPPKELWGTPLRQAQGRLPQPRGGPVPLRTPCGLLTHQVKRVGNAVLEGSA